MHSGTNLGSDLATFTDILKLSIALDSEIPLLGIYAKGIITEICYNEEEECLADHLF